VATIHNSVGADYAFLHGGAPFSLGVIALPGFEIVRARFSRPIALAAGFEAIAEHLREHHRPLTALCSAELRSPEPMSGEGFARFNADYGNWIRRWGLLRDGASPVSRSNVCPVTDPPTEPSFHAFCYTIPGETAQAGSLTRSGHSERAPGPRSFVLAGCTERLRDRDGAEQIIAAGDCTPAGIQRKAGAVLEALEARCAGLGADWRALTAMQVYTAHDPSALAGAEFAPRGLMSLGLHWFACRPPVIGLDFEIDARCVRRELVID
jgi:hypothetical protein